jgi:hypothetical protein
MEIGLARLLGQYIPPFSNDVCMHIVDLLGHGRNYLIVLDSSSDLCLAVSPISKAAANNPGTDTAPETATLSDLGRKGVGNTFVLLYIYPTLALHKRSPLSSLLSRPSVLPTSDRGPDICTPRSGSIEQSKIQRCPRSTESEPLPLPNPRYLPATAKASTVHLRI